MAVTNTLDTTEEVGQKVILRRFGFLRISNVLKKGPPSRLAV